ncbi:MAG TPA: M1 family metallopeptidase [Acidobacteriota bacterium]
MSALILAVVLSTGIPVANPALPRASPRIANYTIDVRLLPQRKRLEGTLILEWRNSAEQALSEFPLHLYWNAFKHNLTEVSRGEKRRPEARIPPAARERAWAYQHLRSITMLELDGEVDLLPTLKVLHPDVPNLEDQTVVQIRTPRPVEPGATLKLRIEWVARIPHGAIPRSGWVHDYFFMAQWFPKLGVHWHGAWNCHTFHPTTEFFADFGVYRVRVTTPAAYVVGATGALRWEQPNQDGSVTREFYQEDVHDFAWAASPQFRVYRDRFSSSGLHPVALTLLLQPEHTYLARRYLDATKHTLRHYGRWYGEYPYAQLTVVDPAYGSGSGGMEYPTLFTGGASIFDPPELQKPEGVTVHECGHQFWYGLVANNEFEEAWLDEGFNTYSTAKVLDLVYGPVAWAETSFGLQYSIGRTGIPIVAPGVWIERGEDRVASLRQKGTVDRMARRAWEYRNRDAYGLNAYSKPALVLQTLERLLGDEVMNRVMRTFHHRWRFGHPTTEDFITSVEQVSGASWRWFFEQTFFSSEICDYAIERVRNLPRRSFEGYRDRPGREPVLIRPPADAAETGAFESEVLAVRKGGVRLPVEVLVEFEDGQQLTERWDGQERWIRYRYQRPARIRRAVVDPNHALMIDIDYANNSWIADRSVAPLAGLKAAGRWLRWMQDLLELYAAFS